MTVKMSKIFNEEETKILNAIQPGGNNWYKNGYCMESCPYHKRCKGWGPDNVCSEDWGDARVDFDTLNVLFHIYTNFDHYNQNDVKETQKSKVIVSIKSRLVRELLGSSREEDEVELKNSDLEKVRMHKAYERNAELAKEAKRIHLYVCKACGFDFKKVYGDLGEKYIEAHHLTTIAEVKGNEEGLDPKKDFTVLCANCHRMIHRSDYISDVDGFRKRYLEN